ncbi:Fungal Zn(2)-Cys(6) binuclear cluster domain-containing protein 11 [Elsinoe fawcettii]|nr:Fungal Zn(2)-Cys(6) binuclear cluster domain-containing protein 11 [Elsinoe fawcettii]
MSSKRTASDVDLESPRHKRKPHRRTNWTVCIECRLRKQKCITNGKDPCKNCEDRGLECTYAPTTRTTLPPTVRIRALEETLRHVRTTLQETDSQGLRHEQLTKLLERIDPSTIGNEYLAHPVLSGSADEQQQGAQPPPARPSPSNRTQSSQTQRTTSSHIFFGPNSGHSIIFRTSKSFQQVPQPDERTARLQSAVTSLFRPETQLQDKYFSRSEAVALPSLPDLVDLYKHCFEEHLLLFQVVVESELTHILGKLSDGPLPNSDKALLHGIVALGYARGRQRHAGLGCTASLDVAAQHFSAAQSLLNVARCESVSSLQAVLCMVVYLTSVSDIVSAHTFSSISCSWILQLGLHRLQHGSHSDEVLPAHRSKDLLIVASKLHLHLTSILDLPQALQRRQVDPDIWASVQSRYDSHLATEMDRSSPSSCHFLLLEVTKEGLEKTFTHSERDMAISTDEAKEDIDLSQLGSVEARLQELIERSSASTAKISNNKMAAGAKAELEMTTYSCQLMLYMPFMHHAVAMANGSPVSRTRSQRVLTCIKVASKTIGFCESQMKHKMLEPSSWFQTYTLFLAILTLVFLIASHKGTTHPSEAWKKGEQGIRLLASMRCHDNGAVKCLRVLKAIIDQLSHTVEFDIDNIEKTTPLLCEGSGRRSSSAPSGNRPSPQNRDSRMAVSSVMQRDQSAADRMLAEAHDFVLFGNNDGFGAP